MQAKQKHAPFCSHRRFFEKTPVAAERCVFLLCLLCAPESVFCCLSSFAENPKAGTPTWNAIMMCPRIVVLLFFPLLLRIPKRERKVFSCLSSFAENPKAGTPTCQLLLSAPSPSSSFQFLLLQRILVRERQPPTIKITHQSTCQPSRRHTYIYTT